ncbi:beta-galactosidase [Pseudoscourfieldia marina]
MPEAPARGGSGSIGVGAALPASAAASGSVQPSASHLPHKVKPRDASSRAARVRTFEDLHQDATNANPSALGDVAKNAPPSTSSDAAAAASLPRALSLNLRAVHMTSFAAPAPATNTAHKRTKYADGASMQNNMDDEERRVTPSGRKNSADQLAASFPLDWIPSKRVAFVSGKPMPNGKPEERAALAVANACAPARWSGISGAADFTADDEASQLAKALTTFVYPDRPWPTTVLVALERSARQHSVSSARMADTPSPSTTPGSRGAGDEAAEAIAARLSAFTDATRSLLRLLETKQCPVFYAIAPELAVCFHMPGMFGTDAKGGGEAFGAVLSPTTRGLRAQLTSAGIAYVPMDSRASSSSAAAEPPAAFDEEDEAIDKALNGGDTLGALRDHRSAVYVQGLPTVSLLVDLLVGGAGAPANSLSPPVFRGAGTSAGGATTPDDVPTLHAPVPFANATWRSVPLTPESVAQSTRTLRLGGEGGTSVVPPWTTSAVFRVLERRAESEQASLSATLDPPDGAVRMLRFDIPSASRDWFSPPACDSTDARLAQNWRIPAAPRGVYRVTRVADQPKEADEDGKAAAYQVRWS